MCFSLGAVLICLSALAILSIIKSTSPKEDRDFIFRVLTAGLVLRIILLITYYCLHLAPGHADILGPDGEAYSQRGWYISRLLQEDDPNIVPDSEEYIFQNYRSNIVELYRGKLPSMEMYQVGAFSYLMGVLYAVFGYSPLIVKLMNAIFSLLTGFLIYLIARAVFNNKIAKVSMAATVFLPSSVVFSITALKDPIIVFLNTMVILLLIQFRRTANWFWPMASAVIILSMDLWRPTIKLPLFGWLALTTFLCTRVSGTKKILVLLSVSVFILFVPCARDRVITYFSPDTFFNRHIGYINTPGNNYKIFPERCYYGPRLIGLGPLEISGGIFNGVLHSLLEPLLSRNIKIVLLPAVVQTVLLNLLLPFAFIGLLLGARYRFYQILPIAVYLVIFIFLIAVSGGNVGTVFRHRDMLMPFILTLAVAGLYSKTLRKIPF